MEAYFKLHLLALVAGFILDLILGDPYYFYHPIRLIGSLIAWLDKHLLGNKRNEGTTIKDAEISKKSKLLRGAILVIIVVSATVVVATAILGLSYFINLYLGVIVEAVMTYQILALKSLRVESMKVYKELTQGTLASARKAVSMIVGRDTELLDELGVAKAAIETVAENTSDGVIAPLIYLTIGGPILGFAYKAVNTMDSMLGYKNDKYLYFGRAAAKLDDVVNYLPARISAWLMISASFLLAVFNNDIYSGKRAVMIYRRDCRRHASPNSAQTESACAGALGIQLAGDASYFGVIHKKPYIGDATRLVCNEDIKRANLLMYVTAFICFAICCGVWLLIS